MIMTGSRTPKESTGRKSVPSGKDLTRMLRPSRRCEASAIPASVPHSQFLGREPVGISAVELLACRPSVYRNLVGGVAATLASSAFLFSFLLVAWHLWRSPLS